MNILDFNKWCKLNELSSQSASKPIESDGGEPQYNWVYIKDILGNTYNMNIETAKLKEYEENILRKQDGKKSDDYLIKKFVEYKRNDANITPSYQDGNFKHPDNNQLIMNSDFYAKAMYDELSDLHNKGEELKNGKNINNEAFVDNEGNLQDFENDEEILDYLSKIYKKDDNLKLEPNFNKDLRLNIQYLENKAKKLGSVELVYVQGWDKFRRLGFSIHMNNYIKKDVIKLCISHNRDFNIDLVTFGSNLVYFLGRTVDVKIDLNSIEWDDELPNIKGYDFLERIFNIAKKLGFEKGLNYLNKVANTKNLYYSKYFRLYEDGGVAAVSGVNSSGMGAVVTSQPSSIPGDVSGATTGSGDIGATYGMNRNVIARPIGSRRKKKAKAKAKEMLKNFSNTFKGTEYKKGGDKGVAKVSNSNIMSFADFTKK